VEVIRRGSARSGLVLLCLVDAVGDLAAPPSCSLVDVPDQTHEEG
jgi:hypothetical protein